MQRILISESEIAPPRTPPREPPLRGRCGTPLSTDHTRGSKENEPDQGDATRVTLPLSVKYSRITGKKKTFSNLEFERVFP
jgi:hypothetical protein